MQSIDEVVSVRVMPGWREADGRHIAALAVTLRPGWKTYWRSAGSLGISPTLSWQGSDNAQSVSSVWPIPEVFPGTGGQSVGYDGDFILPLVVQSRDAQQPITLSGTYDLGVCADICVPARLSIDTVLPAVGQSDPAIRAALRDRPQRADATVRCTLAPSENGLQLTSRIILPRLGPSEAVVFEMPGSDVWITDATVSRQGNALEASAELIGPTAAFDRSALRVTVFSRGKAVEITGCKG